MLKLTKSLIGSLLEYGASQLCNFPPSAFNHLEVYLNATVRLTTGLSKWTLIPVLLHEAVLSSVTSRLEFLTRIFLTRLLASPPNLPMGELAHSLLVSPDPSWMWWPPFKNIQVTLAGPLNTILRFFWPPPPTSLHFDVILKGLSFQDPSLPNRQSFLLGSVSTSPSLVSPSLVRMPPRTIVSCYCCCALSEILCWCLPDFSY